ncbi:MAG: hypothetical protein GX053_14765 [Tissierella sp.]|nr:hypothetical protein [Tissierella sp.]
MNYQNDLCLDVASDIVLDMKNLKNGGKSGRNAEKYSAAKGVPDVYDIIIVTSRHVGSTILMTYCGSRDKW